MDTALDSSKCCAKNNFFQGDAKKIKKQVTGLLQLYVCTYL